MEKTYYENERKGRMLLRELFNRFYSDKYDIQPYYTEIDLCKCYDAVVTRFNKDTTWLHDTHLYEVKLRDIDYDTILLEKDKYDALIEERKFNYDGDVKLYYVSCHPSATYVFDLDNVELKWISEHHNISSVEKENGTRLKKICYLQKERGKKINIRLDQIELFDALNKEDINRTIVKQKQTIVSIEWLFGTKTYED